MKQIERSFRLLAASACAAGLGACAPSSQQVTKSDSPTVTGSVGPGGAGMLDAVPNAVMAMMTGFGGGSGVDDAELTPQERRMRELEANMGRTVWEGVLIGAAAGALTGLLTGQEGSDIVKYAAIGGVVGGAAGAYVASKQRSYAEHEEQLDSMIQDVEKSNEQTEEFIASLRRVIAEDKRNLAALDAKIRQGTASRAALDAERERAAENRKVASTALKKGRERQRVYSNAAKIYKKDNPDANLSQLDRELQAYDSHMDALDGLVSTMVNA